MFFELKMKYSKKSQTFLFQHKKHLISYSSVTTLSAISQGGMDMKKSKQGSNTFSLP